MKLILVELPFTDRDMHYLHIQELGEDQALPFYTMSYGRIMSTSRLAVLELRSTDEEVLHDHRFVAIPSGDRLTATVNNRTRLIHTCTVEGWTR